MYVCLCHGVSHTKVEACIARGADSIEQVGEWTHAGTRCGGCHETIERLLAICAALHHTDHEDDQP